MSDKIIAVVATDVTEANAVKFKDDLLAGSKEATAQFTTDVATGNITLPADFAFKSEIASQLGVTEEMYANVRLFTDLTNNALTHAGSTAAVEMFKANPELKTVTMKAPIWKKDSFEGVFNRTGTSRNPKSGEVSSYVGAVGVGRINVVSTRSAAEYQGIKQNMKNMALAAGLE